MGGIERVARMIGALLLLLSLTTHAAAGSGGDATESAWVAFEHLFEGLMVLEWWEAGLRRGPGLRQPASLASAVTPDLLAAQEHFRRFEAAVAPLAPSDGERGEVRRLEVVQGAARRIREGVDEGIERLRAGEAAAIGRLAAARCAAVADGLAFFEMTAPDDLFPNEVFLDRRAGLERLYRWQRRFLERSRC